MRAACRFLGLSSSPAYRLDVPHKAHNPVYSFKSLQSVSSLQKLEASNRIAANLVKGTPNLCSTLHPQDHQKLVRQVRLRPCVATSSLCTPRQAHFGAKAAQACTAEWRCPANSWLIKQRLQMRQIRRVCKLAACLRPSSPAICKRASNSVDGPRGKFLYFLEFSRIRVIHLLCSEKVKPPR